MADPDKPDIVVTPECQACGGTVFETADNPADDSPVTCKSCGRGVGTYADFVAAQKRTAIEAMERRLIDDAAPLNRTITLKF